MEGGQLHTNYSQKAAPWIGGGLLRLERLTLRTGVLREKANLSKDASLGLFSRSRIVAYCNEPYQNCDAKHKLNGIKRERPEGQDGGGGCRLLRPLHAPPLAPVRSLYYFVPVDKKVTDVEEPGKCGELP